MRTPLLALLISIPLGLSAAADEPRPRKLDATQLGGAIFSDPATVVKARPGEPDSVHTRDFEAFRAADGHFDAGVYESGAERLPIDEPYGVDEFMYFLKGGVTLTGRDGSVTSVRAGEAVVVPKEWRGVWQTEGYTKIYVIYSPDKPIE
jgi:uncharacterized cupin superfamily protein